MEKKNRIRRARERAEEELRNDPNARLLLERIAYHRAKIAEERAAAAARAERRRRLRRLLGLGFLGAD